MKLYVLPVETVCKAKCKFCITKYRKNAENEILKLEGLVKILNLFNFEKIEITGGGEPTIHPKIDNIIRACSKKVPTTMYTHGADLEYVMNLDILSCLCVSMAHYNEEKNKNIMNVYPDMEVIKNISVPIKFSLMLHKSGIHDPGEVINYMNFVNSIADKVVIRQLFEHDYMGKLEGEFVSSERIFQDLGIPAHQLTAHGNPIFKFKELEVEVEYKSCSCELDNPVLHADGKMHRGWDDEIYDINRR